jgi:rhodanese-related sulfurtransferase
MQKAKGGTMEKGNRNHSLSALLIFVGCIALLLLPSWSMGQKGYVNISLDQFVEMLKKKDFILINVHIPYEGEIPGTDLFIPYNAIDQYKEKLPRQKDAKIVLYCRTGRMSAIAAEKLVQLGYTRIFEFHGGMREWERSGRSLLFRSK